MNGETFPEIIGYCYGLMTIKQFKEFICVEPLIPESLNPETFEENIPDELEDNITYLEPLICDDHISLIIFSKLISHRINIILDMSRFHSSTNKLHKSIFPKSVIDQNFKYPEKSIQSYSSSCLWFYGEIETLKNNEKYQSFKSIFKSIREDRVHFYIDIINTISKNFFDIADLFKIEKGKNNIPEVIDLNRLFISGLKKNYTVDKIIVYNQFLDIYRFFFDVSVFDSYVDYKLLIDSQNLLEKYIAYRNQLELNYKFNKYIDEKGDSKILLEFISNQINFVNIFLNQFKAKYDLAFLRNNLSYFECLNDESINIKLSDGKLKEIQNCDFKYFLSSSDKKYEKNYEIATYKYSFYSEREIAKKLNPSNEICFNIMNN